MSTAYYIDWAVEECDEGLYRAQSMDGGIVGLQDVGEEAVRRYHEMGFLVIHQAFSTAQALQARDELAAMAVAEDPGCAAVDLEFDTWKFLEERGFARLEKPDSEYTEADRAELRKRFLDLGPERRAGLVRKFVGFTKQHPPLGSMAKDPALVGVLAALTGGPVRLYQSQALVKPPGGREKPWHQDHAYFNFPLDTPIIGAWVALDAATPQNGCMHVVPRGHAAGPRIHFRRRDWQICDTDMKGEPVLAIPLSAGDALLFDGKLPHGTPPNHTGQQRWAVQYHYVPTRAEMVDPAIRLAAFGSEGKNVRC